MFYLIRGKSKNSAISLARNGDPAKIAEAIAGLREAGFIDVAVLDAAGREIDLAKLDPDAVTATPSTSSMPAMADQSTAEAVLPHV